jgi:hypothetical protein
METKVKHLVAMALKKLKSVGKKKRKRRRAKASVEIARANERGSSDHMVGGSRPSASSAFSNSNNMAIDTQHRVNQAIRIKEDLERKMKADEPTLESKQKELENKVESKQKEMESNINFGLNHLNSKFSGPAAIDDTAPQNFNPPPESNNFIAQTPAKHVVSVQIVNTPDTTTDYRQFDGGSSRRSMFTDVNNDPWNHPEPYEGETDGIDNYNTWDTPKAEEERKEEEKDEGKEEGKDEGKEEEKDEAIPAAGGGGKRLGNNAARAQLIREIISDTGKPLPSGMEHTTSKPTLVSYWNREKHIRETESNDKKFKEMFNK